MFRTMSHTPNNLTNEPAQKPDVTLEFPKVEGAYFSCWAESHGDRVAQVFLTRRNLGDASPECEICGAVMTYGRYTSTIDTGIVIVDPKTGKVKDRNFHWNGRDFVEKDSESAPGAYRKFLLEFASETQASEHILIDLLRWLPESTIKKFSEDEFEAEILSGVA